MRRWAAKEVPQVDIEFQTKIFLDHEFKKTYTDWKATWRNWMRSPINNGNGFKQKPIVAGSNLLTDEEKEQYRKTGDWHV
jgi:hypothetical protein